MKIAVVQDRPTQFDAPFYATFSDNTRNQITIFYTRVSAYDIKGIDSEVGIAPQWDNLNGLKYDARFIQSTFSLWREIVTLSPKHVVICGWYPRSHAILALLLRLSGVRIGVRSDNTLEHTNFCGLRGWLKRLMTSVWLGFFHSWHPVGSLARTYMQTIAFWQRPVFYFPYAIDVDMFVLNATRQSEQVLALRNKYHLESSNFVVLGVMKWTDREDPLTLVDAFLRASAEVPHMKLLLVGNGPLKAEIENRFAQARHRVATPGYVRYSELPFFYAMADLFVHPAQSEPYGVSVQEALACGLSILVSNKVGAAADFLEPGLNGDIFPVGDVGRLAELLVHYSKREGQEVSRLLSVRKAKEWSYRRTIAEFDRCLEAEF